MNVGEVLWTIWLVPISFHVSHTLHTQVIISWVFHCVGPLSWSIKMFWVVGVCVWHTTHTHQLRSKNIALHLLRNTQLRGKRLFFWVKPRKRAVENEGGLWHDKKLGSLVSCCSNIRRADGDCHTDKNSSWPLLCNTPWPVRTNRLIKVNLQQPFENFLPRKCKQINLNVLITFLQYC